MKFLATLCTFLIAAPALALANQATFDHGSVSLAYESQAQALILTFDLDPGWHIYWKNPGEAGLPTEISFKAPLGAVIDELRWPTPKQFQYGDLISIGYEGKVILAAPVTISSKLNPKNAYVNADVSFLLCRDECIPSTTTLGTPLIGGESAEFRGEIPAETQVVEGYVSYKDGDMLLKLPGDAVGKQTLGRAEFFPASDIGLDLHGNAVLNRDIEGNILVQVPIQKSAKKLNRGETFSGLLVVHGKNAGYSLEVHGVIDQRPLIVQVAPFLAALLAAFVGGLILNLMPCVFPVISIKILGFVEHGAAKIHGFLFTAGVLVSFWILSGMLLALRSSGSQLGWGFQFQSPAFIVCMILTVFVLGLSLLGVFEVGYKLQNLAGQVGNKAQGYQASFMSGILATVLATPCTAPFMGSAVAFALSLPAIACLGIFTSLGLGMSLPYIVLSCSPRLIKYMPRPGEWMVTFKQLMAFPMFATVVWLLWVLGVQQGANAVVACVGALVSVGFGVWAVHRFAAPISGKLERRAAWTGFVACLVSGLVIAWPSPKDVQARQDSGVHLENGIAWEDFSAQKLQAYRKEGRTVLVNFTAAWCLSCQMNHQVTYGSTDVRAAIKKNGVVALRADWTSSNPVISEALHNLGRDGVPLDVVYHGEAAANILPAVLTPAALIEAVENK